MKRDEEQVAGTPNHQQFCMIRKWIGKAKQNEDKPKESCGSRVTTQIVL